MSSRHPPERPHILVVCTANAIRSPFVEHLLRSRATKRGIQGLEVASAGTAARMGQPAEEEARSLASDHGISLEDHRTRLLTEQMLHPDTTVLCAERMHRRAVLRMRPDLISTVFTIREFARLVEVSRTPDVVDTWTALVAGAASARFRDRHVAEIDDDIIDPIAQDTSVWAEFERHAVAAVDTVANALPMLVSRHGLSGASPAQLTRRQLREARRTNALVAHP